MMGGGERGGVSVSQIVLLALVAGVFYLGYLYLPLPFHRLAMGRVADEIAHKMLLDSNDQELMARITQDPTAQELHVGLSDIRLDRASDGSKTCRIHWREQPGPFWNRSQVIEMSVSEKAEFGNLSIKNAQ